MTTAKTYRIQLQMRINPDVAADTLRQWLMSDKTNLERHLGKLIADKRPDVLETGPPKKNDDPLYLIDGIDVEVAPDKK